MKIKLFLFVLVLSFTAFSQSSNVKWLTIQEAEKLNKEVAKPYFIDVYTDWCGWCKTMDKTTFQNSEIAEILNEKYYPVKLNAENRETINFAGKDFKFHLSENGKSGVNILAYSLLGGQLSYPSFVILSPDATKVTHRLQGYMKAPQLKEQLQ